MARIKGVTDEEAGFLTGRLFAAAGKQAGHVPDPIRIMAKSGPTMWGGAFFTLAFDRGKSVDKRLKRLACLKAASMIGCVF